MNEELGMGFDDSTHDLVRGHVLEVGRVLHNRLDDKVFAVDERKALGSAHFEQDLAQFGSIIKGDFGHVEGGVLLQNGPKELRAYVDRRRD